MLKNAIARATIEKNMVRLPLKTAVEKAYAKINYWLSVGEKRADGFHDIETLMQTVSLSDEVTVTLRGGEGISLFVEGAPAVPTDRSNLAWRAAKCFLTAGGLQGSVDIRLKKRIPMAAGLAGGSADAAAVLRALNRLFDGPFSYQALAALAAKLGSDVPFCVGGGLALCRGRGERIMSLDKPQGTRHLLIASSGETVSTADAYAAMDRLPHSTPPAGAWRDCADALSALQLPSSLQDCLYNAFEEVVLPECAVAQSMKRQLSESGAVATLMSGSGSSVFGLYQTYESATAAQNQLPFSTEYVTAVFPCVTQ